MNNKCSQNTDERNLKEGYKRCEDSHVAKVSILFIVIYRPNTISFKISVSFKVEVDCRIIKFTWKHKRLQIAQTVLFKKNRTRESQNLISR